MPIHPSHGQTHNRGNYLTMIVIGILFLGSGLIFFQPPERAYSSINTIKRASSALAISPDGQTLLAVNPDSNSLTLVDTGSLTVLAEILVGVDPRTVAVDDAGMRAYTANRGDNTLTVIDLTTRMPVAQVAVGNQPYGVVVSPAGDRLYLAEQGGSRVAVLSASTFDVLETYLTRGRPSGLAVSQDGRTLYVTHLLDNQITAITVRPYFAYLPFTRKTLSGTNSRNQIISEPPSAISHLQTNIPLWPDSNLVQSVVISPDGQRAYIPHTRSNTGNRALTFDTTVFPLVSVVDLNSHQHLIGQQIDLGSLDPPGVGLPFDAAITPDGHELWVANAASNDLSVIDLASRQLTSHIEVGDNPRGIVLSPQGDRAYVNNTLAGTLSVIDTSTYTVTHTLLITELPVPPALLNGKRLFHSSDDPRMALAQWISCNTCHFEGEHDGRTWFFGFAGPRNNTSLLGMVETYPLRWSGEWDESADAEFVIRSENFGSGLIAGPVNCSLSPLDCVHQPPNQGRDYDLDTLAAYIDSLSILLSPAHARSQPLDDAELRGQAIFLQPALGCLECHPPPLYTDLQTHDVGTVTPDERIGPAFDTPSLRGLYGSAPYFHDGSAATLFAALTRPSPNGEHDVREILSSAEIQDLITFLLALPFEY
jgi:YVTN family beta-propeller protein